MLTDESISTAKVAEVYGIAVRTVYAWIAAGVIPAPDMRNTSPMRWRRSTLEQWERDGCPPQPIPSEGKQVVQ